MGIEITGSLGLLLSAKNKGIVNEVKPILNKIGCTNFRISNDLISKVLTLTNER